MSKDTLTLLPDQAAAHELLSELRTRISTQPLPYQYGVESRALESLWEVFSLARSAMKNHPGCKEFAYRTTRMLNIDLRPVTAKWHRAHQEGRLNSRDGANEFRSDLEAVQERLREFAAEPHLMAYGEPLRDDLSPTPLSEKDIEACLDPVNFGIHPKSHVDDKIVTKINKMERDEIDARRRAYNISENSVNAVGLGLSGGGIRSATFCLGVSQVLAERGLLKDVDFLSTVSGGGYLGCFLTTRIDNPEAYSGVASPHGPDPEPVLYLHWHAKYLAPSNLKERWAMVTATLAGMILNWTAPLLLIVLLALAAVGTQSLMTIPWEGLLLTFGAVTLVSMLVYAFCLRYQARAGGWFFGMATAVTAFILFLWFLAWLHDGAYGPIIAMYWKIPALLGTAVTAFPSIIRFIPVLRKPEVRRVVLKVILGLAGLIVPVGAIALLFWMYDLGRMQSVSAAAVYNPLHYADGYVALLVLTAVFAFVAVFLLNVNLTAPHRLYRDQLARTFIHRGRKAADTAPIPLSKINNRNFAPYHLINATLNLPSSESPALRERRSDFFLFSKHFCGAPSIGYFETPKWLTGKEQIDLATAMAVSGAAASSHMGLGSIPTLSALLTLLNIRLGYWIRRPGKGGPKAPGFMCLIREMFGICMSEEDDWFNLSDGGHIENMGVYELLRRRCKFIISVDGEADPESTFHGHLTLVRHAQIDFGVRIETNLTEVRADATTKLSQSHSMMCRVHYPDGKIGLLLYLKLSVTGDEPELIKNYRAFNPDFPHQTTLDQFFEEDQFEAYRQLGVHVAEGLFSPALLGTNTHPANTETWFASLARNLLLPQAASGDAVR